MKRIVLMGATINNPNRGCDALTMGALNLILKIYTDFEIITFDASKNKRIENHTFNIDKKEVYLSNIYFDSFDFYFAIPSAFEYLVFKKTKNRIINSLADANYIYNICYGDSFADIYDKKRLLILFINSICAIILGKPLVFLPQTIGPFNTLLGKILAFIVLHGCKKVYVRDKMANKFLKSIGVKFEETFDLSVYMMPEKVDIEIPENSIGINISSLLLYGTDLNNTNGFEYYPKLIHLLIKRFLDMGKNILFIPHTYDIKNGGPIEDLQAIYELKKEFDSDKIKVVDKLYTAPQLKYIISKCDFLVGSRMHSCFAGLSTSTPTVGLGYSYKFKGGFEMFGTPECAISLKGLKEKDVDNMVENIIQLYEKREQFKNILSDVNKNKKVLNI